MSKSNSRVLNPPEPNPGSVGSANQDALVPAILDLFCDWRARRLDDDPAFADGWTRFFHETIPHLSAANRRGRRSACEPEDEAQEICLTFLAWLRQERIVIEHEESPAEWTIASKRRPGNLRRHSAWRLQEPLDDATAAALVSREDDPAIAYERGRFRTLVGAAFEEARVRLPERSYRIIVLRWIEEWTYCEIAEALAMPVARVRDRHRRAFGLLRVLVIRRFGLEASGLLATALECACHELENEEVTP